MDNKNSTVPLVTLLDEISNDLDELRKQNPTDHSFKGIAMFWNLERERVVARHNPQTAVKKHQQREVKRALLWFFGGWMVMISLQATFDLLA